MSHPRPLSTFENAPAKSLPARGLSKSAVLEQLRNMRCNDARHEDGRCFGLVYATTPEVDELLQEAASLTLLENAFNPRAFPSLRQMEDDIVSVTSGLLSGGPDTGGVMTSGGTESILLAVKTARDRHRSLKRGTRGNIVVPRSAHPAFRKAADLLDVDWVQLPMDSRHHTDPDDLRAAIDADTVLAVASAPSYPWGIMDDIPALSAVAAERGVPFHVDASIGGFFLPFAERAGFAIPAWDFRVPGVTSISADLHKFGYSLKGASVLLHRFRKNMRYQFFQFSDWPGGAYGTRSFMGSRPGAPISAAWAVLHYLGEEGYVRLARDVMRAIAQLRAGLPGIGAHIWGEPVGPALAIGSEHHDILAGADVLALDGWHVDRQERPDAIHLMVAPRHAQSVPLFLRELGRALVAGAMAGRRFRANYGEDFARESFVLRGSESFNVTE